MKLHRGSWHYGRHRTTPDDGDELFSVGWTRHPCLGEWDGDRSPAATYPRWMDHAACGHRPDLNYFPANGRLGPTRKVCDGCPVAIECLTYAVTNRIDCGVWGGLNATDRETLTVAS